jgi:HSF-type DNA-binding
MSSHSRDEHLAASAVAALLSSGSKRSREDDADHAAGGVANKAARIDPAPEAALHDDDDDAGMAHMGELKPYPFFYYEDFSAHVDPDPLTPLTPPGRVPNFPAKMHSILSRPELAEIVCWMPHGRSWRVLKPREFEIRVIPTYFEHAKVRNAWNRLFPLFLVNSHCLLLLLVLELHSTGQWVGISPYYSRT